MEGWIKLHRKLLDNPIIKDHTAYVLFTGILMLVDRRTGTYTAGRYMLSERFDIKPTTVYQALKRLEKKYKIVTQVSNNKFTTIQVRNWHEYQGSLTQAIENKVKTNGKRIDTKQEVKKLRSKEDIYVHFEKIWERYPNRIGKKQALTHYKSSVKSEEDIAKINHALDNYLASSQVKKGYIQHGSTWFNNWQDWVDFKETKVAKTKKEDEFFDKDASRAELARLKGNFIKSMGE